MSSKLSLLFLAGTLGLAIASPAPSTGALQAADADVSLRGGPLRPCGTTGTTGFLREGSCQFQKDDSGCAWRHALEPGGCTVRTCASLSPFSPCRPCARALAADHEVCVTMSQKFLDNSASKDGNDLSSVVQPGGHWCICAWAWASAVERDPSEHEGLDLVCDATNGHLREVYSSFTQLSSPSGLQYKSGAALDAVNALCPRR